MANKTKTKTNNYVLLSKHRAASGKVFEAGDTIKLTDKQAKNLTNKIRDPKDLVVSNSGGNEKFEASEAANVELAEKLKVSESANVELAEKLKVSESANVKLAEKLKVSEASNAAKDL